MRSKMRSSRAQSRTTQILLHGCMLAGHSVCRIDSKLGLGIGDCLWVPRRLLLAGTFALFAEGGSRGGCLAHNASELGSIQIGRDAPLGRRNRLLYGRRGTEDALRFRGARG